ncbi:membrane bound O-acyl transferase family-domain-containing protein [Paraphoma chrysanthemicola]|uniref:Membrane bound O-acyl transferase family-domain-containing protein n=1 Tax=Paraphoma chrysanthemicola TaxID=798071 RepID=A0A8K0RCY9_9PLEO|nr:membrane bound O-acyl transferase family-domain-containing protein [Paraphoma chrysanthemicola]
MSNTTSIFTPAPEKSWQPSDSLPAFLWGITLVITSLLIVTFPQHLNRWSAISILIVPACGAFHTGDNIFPDEIFVDYYLRFITILSSHITWLAFRDPSTLATNPMSTKGKLKERHCMCLHGYKLLFNPRGVGTQWEVPILWPGYRYTTEITKETTPHVNQVAKAGRNTLPHQSKWPAIGTRFVYLFFKFAFLCLYYDFLSPSTLLSLTPSDFASLNNTLSFPSRTSFTIRAILTRISLAIGNFLPDYLILSSYHDMFAIFFIGINLDESWEWPPLFGSISEAYSMRRFWGMFWHKLIYRSFNGHASVISTALGMRQKGMAARIVNNWLVFVLSAVMHGLVPWKMGVGCAWRVSAEYWMLQPIAFVVEGVVQWCWARVRQTRLRGVNREVLSGFERGVGYICVITWLLWEAPRRDSAVVRCHTVTSG